MLKMMPRKARTKWILIAIMLTVIGTLLFSAARRAPKPPLPVKADIASDQVTQEQKAPRRAVYPYSIVPGGIRNAEDLRKVMAASPEIYNHFADFDFDHATFRRVTGCYFVSLLKGGIRWTKKCVWLHDEEAITDGKYIVLLRCGNRIAEKPQVPTEDVDISQPILIALPDMAEIPATRFLSSLTADNPAPLFTQASPAKDPRSSACCPFGTPGGHNTPVRVPEPNMFSMMGLGLLGIVLIYWCSRKQRDKRLNSNI